VIPGSETQRFAVGSDQDPVPALEVRDLRKDFGGVHAVAGATFDVRRGTIAGLIGPNGAGKSTAINLISGFVKPSGGRVVVEGVDTSGWSAHRVARQGLIRTFQLSSAFARLTVMENLLVAAPRQRGTSVGGALLGKRYWRGAERAAVVEARDLLERVGLRRAEDQYAEHLSGGQKRLLEIARALMARPRVLLLDEPFAGVNRPLARHVEQLLLGVRDDGVTILLVEHEMGAIERLCTTVVVMALGQVLAEGSMSDIRANREVVGAYLGG
jgi:ABC-type branched-subunit amino acid transport system ATPase component